jgi:hypothetical protein
MRRLLFLLFILVSSLNLLSQANGPKVIELTKKDLEKSPSTLSAIADRISFVKLETVPGAFIGNADSYYCLQIPSGFIIYPGRAKEDILLFDKVGKFKTKVGRIGRGPGEYSEFYRVIYDEFNDQILVSRLFMDWVLIFSSEGKYIKTVTVEKGDVRLDKLTVFDKSHWMYTYEKPIDGEFSEVGVLKIDHNGRIIKKYNLTEKSYPGCYGNSPQRNLLYRSGNEILYSYFPFSKTLRLTTADSWELAYILKSPIPEGPIELYSRNAYEKQMSFHMANGVIISYSIYSEFFKVIGAGPIVFNILIDRKTGEKYSWGLVKEAEDSGLIDDLAGGPPFELKSISKENNSVGMIDAQKFLAFRDKGLLGKSFNDKKSFEEINQILDQTNIDDNPIIRIVHIK